MATHTRMARAFFSTSRHDLPRSAEAATAAPARAAGVVAATGLSGCGGAADLHGGRRGLSPAELESTVSGRPVHHLAAKPLASTTAGAGPGGPGGGGGGSSSAVSLDGDASAGVAGVGRRFLSPSVTIESKVPMVATLGRGSGRYRGFTCQEVCECRMGPRHDRGRLAARRTSAPRAAQRPGARRATARPGARGAAEVALRTATARKPSIMELATTYSREFLLSCRVRRQDLCGRMEAPLLPVLVLEAGIRRGRAASTHRSEPTWMVPLHAKVMHSGEGEEEDGKDGPFKAKATCVASPVGAGTQGPQELFLQGGPKLESVEHTVRQSPSPASAAAPSAARGRAVTAEVCAADERAGSIHSTRDRSLGRGTLRGSRPPAATLDGRAWRRRPEQGPYTDREAHVASARFRCRSLGADVVPERAETGASTRAGARWSRGEEAHKPVDLQREVRSLLNKISPDNSSSILAQLTRIRPTSEENFKIVAQLAMNKALDDPFYSEIYARVIKTFIASCPASASGASFQDVVLAQCEKTFNDFFGQPETLADGCQGDEVAAKHRLHAHAFMRLVGHLLQRRVICPELLRRYLHTMLLVDLEDSDAAQFWPPRAWIECACELLVTVGRELSFIPEGKVILKTATSRLHFWRELRRSGSDDDASSSFVYPPRIQFLIQDVTDMSKNNWTDVSFTEKGVAEKAKCKVCRHRPQSAAAAVKRALSAGPRTSW